MSERCNGHCVGRETQESIYLWSEETFPGPDRETGIRSQIRKLLEEAIELAMVGGMAHLDVLNAVDKACHKVRKKTGQGFYDARFDLGAIGEEAGDNWVVLNVLAGRCGFVLVDEGTRKMGVNRLRRQVVDPSGMAQHVAEDAIGGAA